LYFLHLDDYQIVSQGFKKTFKSSFQTYIVVFLLEIVEQSDPNTNTFVFLGGFGISVKLYCLAARYLLNNWTQERGKAKD